MLDSETKRRIDTARDILVGKVPDPKSQVEQITIALIYKFMDDMDSQSEEVGGKRKFFAGEFAKYGWAKLMAPSVSGEERIALYAESIVKMPQNPGIPPLFRDIFKNAYLPYRDPETLKAFLKVIDGFEYDHSERLGDAFEYLLSVLGSQGDAGQFRTPRHIIDFMVSVVDPKKGETVLDPACGTAGFLISAYKHILRANSSPSPSGRGQGEGALSGEAALHVSKIPAAPGDKLNPDERKKLAENFTGYDISPDMVRLSLVNLYLHGFKAPRIHEYDTLTSLDNWGKAADVILANPPFMSPKGGIKPHNRFSVPSKRSEVLFVDYMAEHLTPGGRAAIIVPEGIIFQSQTAYKTLRKMLVEQYLVAVVSLPAGIFNPYAGVKTSILLLDKSLAKQSDTVGFFKVENDGFNLGAQRRPIDKNDLPQVLTEIEEYLRRLRAKESVAPEDFTPTRGLIVAKEKIAANGDFNLSGERYRDGAARSSSFPFVALGDICELARGVVYNKGDEVETDGVPVLRANNINAATSSVDLSDVKRIAPKEDFSDDKKLRKDDIFICLASGSKDHIGKVALIPSDTDYYFGGFMGAVRAKADRVNAAYLFQQLRDGHFNDFLREQIAGANINNLSGGLLYRFEIPLPPLEVQKEIVAEIEAYQKVIDGARAVLDHYRPHIPINPEWPMVELGTVCMDIRTGPFGSLLHQSDYVLNGIPLVNPQDIVGGAISTDKVKTVSPEMRDRMSEFTLSEHDIVIGRRGEMGRCAIVPARMDGWLCGTGCCIIRLSPACDVRFIAHQLRSPRIADHLEQHSVGVTMKNLNHGLLNALLVPLPPLAEQEKIEAEQRLVEGNRQLIERMEQKIAATLARIWGEDRAVHSEVVAAPPIEIIVNAPLATIAYLPGLAACYIAHALRSDPNFGRTKLEKVNHFIEYHAGVPLDRHAKPYMYGPVDFEQLKRAEAWAGEQHAFVTNDPGDGSKVTYTPGQKLGDLARQAAQTLQDRKPEVDRILDLLRGESTRRCEIFATVYAAWNDLLLRGQPATDPAIMDEIRAHWHERKQTFSDKDWRIGLNWLRINNLMPAGTGRQVAAVSLE